jgi:hypothetical protein
VVGQDVARTPCGGDEGDAIAALSVYHRSDSPEHQLQASSSRGRVDGGMPPCARLPAAAVIPERLLCGSSSCAGISLTAGVRGLSAS